MNSPLPAPGDPQDSMGKKIFPSQVGKFLPKIPDWPCLTHTFKQLSTRCRTWALIPG